MTRRKDPLIISNAILHTHFFFNIPIYKKSRRVRSQWEQDKSELHNFFLPPTYMYSDSRPERAGDISSV